MDEMNKNAEQQKPESAHFDMVDSAIEALRVMNEKDAPRLSSIPEPVPLQTLIDQLCEKVQSLTIALEHQNKIPRFIIVTPKNSSREIMINVNDIHYISQLGYLHYGIDKKIELSDMERIRICQLLKAQ